MRIGIDAKDIEGNRTGVGRYLINLLKHWKDEDIILYFKKDIPDLPFQKRVLGSSSNAWHMHYSLPRAAKKDKVDILFCPAYVSPLFYSGKTALTLHDIVYEVRPDLYSWPSFADRFLLKKVSRISARKADVIFVPSEYTKKEVVKHYQISPEKVFVTYLGIDETVKPVRNLKKIEEMGIKDKFILYYGSISNRRHLPEIMQAFEKISGYQFIVIGKNITSPFIDIDGLVKEINGRLGREAILRKDFVSDEELSLLYGSAELLVWLSEYEGYGLPVAEALSCGVPVVTSPITSIPEVAGEAALYVRNPENIDEIYQTIHRGLMDRELRNNLIEKGLEQVKKFSWEKCAEKTMNILKKYGKIS